MCNIVFKPADKEIPRDMLVDLKLDNPDGYGAMYSEDGELQVVKNVKDIHAVYERIVDKHAYLHARWATHGLVNETNCHPFKLKIKGETYGIMHNGIFSGIKIQHPKLSDTWHFVHNRLRHWLEQYGVADARFYEKVYDDLGGGKLVIMRGSDGAHWIYNRSLWKDKDGLLFSSGVPTGYVWTYYRGSYTGHGNTDWYTNWYQKKDEPPASDDTEDHTPPIIERVKKMAETMDEDSYIARLVDKYLNRLEKRWEKTKTKPVVLSTKGRTRKTLSSRLSGNSGSTSTTKRRDVIRRGCTLIHTSTKTSTQRRGTD